MRRQENIAPCQDIEPARPDLFSRRPRDGNAEARRQAAIVDYVRWVAPDVVIWAVPNGGWRTKAEAARLKWVGVLAGVLDLSLALPNGRSAYWETKTAHGRLSSDQFAFIRRLEGIGHTWAVVRGIEDARFELARLGVKTKEVLMK
ncbi:MAG TPA: hypothetical protein VGG68_14945 [Caulobacteraceae bacterium]